MTARRGTERRRKGLAVLGRAWQWNGAERNRLGIDVNGSAKVLNRSAVLWISKDKRRHDMEMKCTAEKRQSKESYCRATVKLGVAKQGDGNDVDSIGIAVLGNAVERMGV